MKSRTIVIKNRYLIFIFILSIVFFTCSLTSKIDFKKQGNIINVQESIPTKNEAQTVQQRSYKEIEPYKNMPQQIEGYEVIGKLEIPKIELTTYILSETDKNTLKFL